MGNFGCQNKITQKKAFIILYFVVSALLIIFSFIPIGYGIKDNGQISFDLTKIDESYNKSINTREYTESYELVVDEDIRIDVLSIMYMADDINFKGVLEATISDGDQVLKTISTSIESTQSEDGNTSFAGARINYGISGNPRHPKPVLLKGHHYTLQIHINTNLTNYEVMESHIPNEYNSVCKFLTDKTIVSNITYTPVSSVRYGDIFYGFVPLLIVLGAIFLLKYLHINPTNNKYINWLLVFVRKYYCEIILILLFVYLAAYEFYHAYIEGVFISDDSSNYLREATAILSGYGFNYTGLSGYDSWFASWPIGYPLLIAAVAFVTGRNVYLSSKILSVALVGLFLLFLYIKFRKDAWIYGLCLLNIGFLQIYCYTWSENPFILGLLLFCLILTHIIETDTVKTKWFILLGCCGSFLFLCRYIGTISLIAIGLVFSLYLCIYIFYTKYRNKEIRNKLIGFIISGAITFLFVVIYYAINYIMSGSISGVNRSEWWDEYTELTNGLWDSLVIEFFNALHLSTPDGIMNLHYHYKIGLVMLFLLATLYLLYKHRSKDFKFVFIGAGMLYNLVFILIRFHSSMNAFYYRFFVPASILITIGLLGYLANWINKYKYWLAPIIIIVLFFSTKTMLDSCKDISRDNTAYRKYQASLEGNVSEVPYRSTIIIASESTLDVAYATQAFRSDINYVYERIDPNVTMKELFDKYKDSDYICIKNVYIKEILYYPIYDYDDSLIDFFADHITEASADDAYTIISVKERKIVFSTN